MKLSTYFFLALLYLFCGNAFGQASVKKPGIDPQKLAAINDLLEITGAVNLSQQVLVKIIEEQKDAHPEIPSQIWDRYEAKLALRDLLDFMIEIYDRHFSTEDLVAVATFYRSAPGQRVIKEMPAVMTEARAAGREWGRKKSAELMKEIEAEKTHPTKLGVLMPNNPFNPKPLRNSA